jgi:hypothetical protein
VRCRCVEALTEVIDDLEVPAHGPALIEGFALADRLAAKLSAALVDFDAAEAWDTEGAASLTSWLSQFAGQSSRQAHGGAPRWPSDCGACRARGRRGSTGRCPGGRVRWWPTWPSAGPRGALRRARGRGGAGAHGAERGETATAMS